VVLVEVLLVEVVIVVKVVLFVEVLKFIFRVVWSEGIVLKKALLFLTS